MKTLPYGNRKGAYKAGCVLDGPAVFFSKNILFFALRLPRREIEVLL